ncbi:MAG: hemerythrin [Desulfovibrio sp.]|nr:MAG: hemerythrin [Desulfovibrio sp.]
MARIHWDSSLNLGIKEIDDQHKELIRIINLLLESVEKGKAEEAVTKTLMRLREYTVYHFSSEEEFLETICYPDRNNHSQRHQQLKQRVKDFQYSRFYKEDITVLEIKEFLSDWLLTHILEWDMNIAKFVREQEGKAGAGQDTTSSD